MPFWLIWISITRSVKGDSAIDIHKAKQQIMDKLNLLMRAKEHRCPDRMSDEYNKHLQDLGYFHDNFEAIMRSKDLTCEQALEYCLQEMLRIEMEDLKRYPEHIVRLCPHDGRRCSVHKTGCGNCQIAQLYKEHSDIHKSWECKRDVWTKEEERILADYYPGSKKPSWL